MIRVKLPYPTSLELCCGVLALRGVSEHAGADLHERLMKIDGGTADATTWGLPCCFLERRTQTSDESAGFVMVAANESIGLRKR